MSRKCILCWALLSVPVGLNPVSALNVLIVNDYAQPTNRVSDLSNTLNGHSVTEVDNIDDLTDDILVSDDFIQLAGYHTVIFYASGKDNAGRLLTSQEAAALEGYVQLGGNLLVTGYDLIGHPDDPLMATLIRSTTTGDNVGQASWQVADLDHFILNGPFGDFRGQTVGVFETDHDVFTPAPGTLSLGTLPGGASKILFTDLGGFKGTVTAWNGNSLGADWDMNQNGGIVMLAMIRNWVAGLDRDSDGIPNNYDGCADDGQKFDPGVCGCGTPDLDQNSNGIMDCQVTPELKAKISQAQALLKKLKVLGVKASKKQKSSQQVMRAGLKALSLEIVSYTSANISKLSVNLDPKKILARANQVKKRLSTAIKSSAANFKMNRASGKKALKLLLKSLG